MYLIVNFEFLKVSFGLGAFPTYNNFEWYTQLSYCFIGQSIYN